MNIKTVKPLNHMTNKALMFANKNKVKVTNKNSLPKQADQKFQQKSYREE